jgi:bacteriocin-like protein
MTNELHDKDLDQVSGGYAPGNDLRNKEVASEEARERQLREWGGGSGGSSGGAFSNEGLRKQIDEDQKRRMREKYGK